ncbi:hypothetical protein HYC85_002027 [Camellia sinensis]|uniref:Uncharacterized protein n=1 Tax=Camellia sinensis TaxID=4442 RepID=A0A7J7I9G3_CAMSI|nr:hypothetical protein HYC85_002027 [Camellia sinensis]
MKRDKTMFINGKFCNDPKLATANDFFFSNLLTPRNTSNLVGSTVTPVKSCKHLVSILLASPLLASTSHLMASTSPHAPSSSFWLRSQNHGVITVANAIYDDVLAKAFQVDKKVVDNLRAQFWWPVN